ncbi:MAG: hypothetical protein ACLTDR_00585 [Adlercreutzia equolifaciens]
MAKVKVRGKGSVYKMERGKSRGRVPQSGSFARRSMASSRATRAMSSTRCSTGRTRGAGRQDEFVCRHRARRG